MTHSIEFFGNKSVVETKWFNERQEVKTYNIIRVFVIFIQDIHQGSDSMCWSFGIIGLI